jgi:uptake hydrogenase small subunit
VLSERGCLMEHLGCKATQAIGDCNQRAWNGGGSCTHAGFACISCTSPGFEAARDVHVTPKIGGIPVGLPLDMPKAWFMTLAALSKSATPARVRTNAEADRIVINPKRQK